MFDYQLLYNPNVEADEVPVTGAKRKAVTENLKDKAT
jgi:hypothetical protein